MNSDPPYLHCFGHVETAFVTRSSLVGRKLARPPVALWAEPQGLPADDVACERRKCTAADKAGNLAVALCCAALLVVLPVQCVLQQRHEHLVGRDIANLQTRCCCNVGVEGMAPVQVI